MFLSFHMGWVRDWLVREDNKCKDQQWRLRIDATDESFHFVSYQCIDWLKQVHAMDCTTVTFNLYLYPGTSHLAFLNSGFK